MRKPDYCRTCGRAHLTAVVSCLICGGRMMSHAEWEASMLAEAKSFCSELNTRRAIACGVSLPIIAPF